MVSTLSVENNKSRGKREHNGCRDAQNVNVNRLGETMCMWWLLPTAAAALVGATASLVGATASLVGATASLVRATASVVGAAASLVGAAASVVGAGVSAACPKREATALFS